MTVTHPFSPLFDAGSEILILGSFPSVASRENRFFYGHPQNRFWKMLSLIYGEPLPYSTEEKRGLILRHHLALYDVVFSCEITGSADSSIRNVVPSDLSSVLCRSAIRKIIVNGKTAEKYYRKYQEPTLGFSAICLPSTSPANAAFSLDTLVKLWGKELTRGGG